MEKENVKTTLQKVLDNNKKLENCVTPHDFQKSTVQGLFRIKDSYVCLKCGGEVTASSYAWYTRGLNHG